MSTEKCMPNVCQIKPFLSNPVIAIINTNSCRKFFFVYKKAHLYQPFSSLFFQNHRMQNPTSSTTANFQQYHFCWSSQAVCAERLPICVRADQDVHNQVKKCLFVFDYSKRSLVLFNCYVVNDFLIKISVIIFKNNSLCSIWIFLI